MSSISPWDAIDASLFTVMHASPSTPVELTEATGVSAEVVKNLLHAYMREGLVTRKGLVSIHYELTVLGRLRLEALTPAQFVQAA